MSAIANLKKAFEAQAITKDTYSLEKFFNKNEVDDVAPMNIVAIESKYVSKFDKRDAEPGSVDGAGNLGFRTRFILADGTTVGTFSNGAHKFFEFFAQLMNYNGEENFLHIDITGNLIVNLSMIALDGKRKTYNFEMVEAGSEFKGLQDFLPTVNNILLNSGEVVDTMTGEIKDEPETVSASEADATTPAKKTK